MILPLKYKSQFNKYEVTTFLRIVHFMTQIRHESGLVSKRESLYFKTIEGLRETFKTPFLNKPDEFVSKYLRNTEKCANYVYANRMGNGNEASGDGYKYRGGGLLQNTGKRSYELLSKLLGINLVQNPDLILEEANAVIAALWFWKENNINKYADIDDLDGVSDIVNIGKKTKTIGDANHFDKRKKLYLKYKKEYYGKF